MGNTVSLTAFRWGDFVAGLALYTMKNFIKNVDESNNYAFVYFCELKPN